MLKKKGMNIISYVIMPNHMHFLIYIPDQAPPVNKLIGNGKRFMAYEIVKRLKQKNETGILQKLSSCVPERERRKNKLHNVFEPSFDAKAIVTEKFLVQKLNYIHANPISGKWDLVNDYRKYPYSSAGFYEIENYNGYMPTHYKDI
jgi:REP element-mobilizing transposase RayT